MAAGWLGVADEEVGFGPDISMETAQRKLPGWLLWHTPNYQSSDTYSARPKGTHVAVPGCSGITRLDALVKAVKKYEADLPEHIAQTRRDLDDTPPEWVGRVEMLTQRLAALEEMARNKGK